MFDFQTRGFSERASLDRVTRSPAASEREPRRSEPVPVHAVRKPARARPRRPSPKVGHARQLWGSRFGQPPQALRRRVEQRAKDARAFSLERGPELRFGAAALVRDWLQRQEHGAIGEVRPGHYVLDWTRAVEQDLVLIRTEPAGAEPAAGGETAERVRKPRLERRDIVERLHMTFTQPR
jgi:hypothetical protein